MKKREGISLEITRKNYFMMTQMRVLLQIICSNLNYFRHKKEYELYESRGIFDVDNIPNHIYPPRVEWAPYNQFYGAEGVLRKAAGIRRPLNAFMEHGIQEKNDIEADEIKEYNRRYHITFSDFRKEQYERLIGDGRPVCVVGPYIKYAQTFYSFEEQKTSFFSSHIAYLLELVTYPDSS